MESGGGDGRGGGGGRGGGDGRGGACWCRGTDTVILCLLGAG